MMEEFAEVDGKTSARFCCSSLSLLCLLYFAELRTILTTYVGSFIGKMIFFNDLSLSLSLSLFLIHSLPILFEADFIGVLLY